MFGFVECREFANKLTNCQRVYSIILMFFTPCAIGNNILFYDYKTILLPTFDTLSVIYVIYILERRVSVHFSLSSSGTNEN
jgi:hypothetical protein